MKKYILSLDQGTTSSRAILFNKQGKAVAVAQKEFSQYYPQPGWVEHDGLEIWSTQAGVALEVITRARADAAEIAGIGITNQRETTLVWDRETGQPIFNAIVWQDRRTANFCDELKSAGHSEMIRKKTGLVVDAYFSATKISWILDYVQGARKRAEEGKLAFGTMDTWLVWNLTRGSVHVTDVSNASRTMLFNIHTLQWDEDLLSLFRIPRAILPDVRSSSEVYGLSTALFSSPIPVSGMAGDQQAALFGQMCIHPGMVKNTYGTGCFLVMNTGNKTIDSANNLLTTIAWKTNGEVQYALEGSVFIAGAVVQWLRAGLGIIRKSADVEKLAAKVPDNGGVYFVPAFAGLGAPYWDQHARGTLVGMTRGTTASHIARAALESIAFQTLDVVSAMRADSGIPISELRVDGGASVNNPLMQFQSDILGAKVVRPHTTETTALGAACLAGLAAGFWENTGAIEKQWKADRIFVPEMDPEPVHRLAEAWKKAVLSARTWKPGEPKP